MQKNELIEEIAAHTGERRATVRRVLDAAADVARSRVAAGGHVFLFGLGKLGSVARPARVARNPRTGAAVAVPARRVIDFRPSTSLVEAAASHE